MHVLQRCNFRGNKNGKVLLISSGGAVNFLFLIILEIELIS